MPEIMTDIFPWQLQEQWRLASHWSRRNALDLSSAMNCSSDHVLVCHKVISCEWACTYCTQHLQLLKLWKSTRLINSCAVMIQADKCMSPSCPRKIQTIIKGHDDLYIYLCFWQSKIQLSAYKKIKSNSWRCWIIHFRFAWTNEIVFQRKQSFFSLRCGIKFPWDLITNARVLILQLKYRSQYAG